MKQLFQIIALNLFGVNALQIILAIASAVLVLQMLSQKISGNRRKWKMICGLLNKEPPDLEELKQSPQN